MCNEVVIVKDLTKTFREHSTSFLPKKSVKKKVAVDHLSFSVRKGEIYGLLGPNGAGKTTTLRILSTLIKPDSGSASILGYDIIGNAEAVRKNIGFLTSELKLDGFLTPNYIFDFTAKMYNIDKNVVLETKNRLFTKFQINEYADIKVSKLSTGMKQKVSFTVSLINDPQLIIFDEPTNGLDIITAKAVTDFLLELKEEGRTIILSTHIFELVEKLCDEVGIIIDGKMKYTNSIRNILLESSLEQKFFQLYRESENV